MAKKKGWKHFKAPFRAPSADVNEKFHRVEPTIEGLQECPWDTTHEQAALLRFEADDPTEQFLFITAGM